MARFVVSATLRRLEGTLMETYVGPNLLWYFCLVFWSCPRVPGHNFGVQASSWVNNTVWSFPTRLKIWNVKLKLSCADQQVSIIFFSLISFYYRPWISSKFRIWRYRDLRESPSASEIFSKDFCKNSFDRKTFWLSVICHWMVNL